MKLLITALLLLGALSPLSADTIYLDGFKSAREYREDPAILFAATVYRYHSDKVKKGQAVPQQAVQRGTAKAVLKNAPQFWKGENVERAYYMMYAMTLSEGEGFPTGNISDPSYGPNCITIPEAYEVCGTYNRSLPSKTITARELETNFDLNYFILAGTMTIRMSRYGETFDYYPRSIAGYKYGDARAADKFRALDYSNARIRGLKPVSGYEKKLRQLLRIRETLLDERRSSRGTSTGRKGAKGSHRHP